MKLVKYTENIPEWAIYYLFMGDRWAEDLTEEEKKMVDDFVAEYRKESVNGRVNFSIIDRTPFFTWYPAFGEAGGCYEVEFAYFIE